MAGGPTANGNHLSSLRFEIEQAIEGRDAVDSRQRNSRPPRNIFKRLHGKVLAWVVVLHLLQDREQRSRPPGIFAQCAVDEILIRYGSNLWHHEALQRSKNPSAGIRGSRKTPLSERSTLGRLRPMLSLCGLICHEACRDNSANRCHRRKLDEGIRVLILRGMICIKRLFPTGEGGFAGARADPLRQAQAGRRRDHRPRRRAEKAQRDRPRSDRRLALRHSSAGGGQG